MTEAIPVGDVEKEFNETFGYVRQDIRALFEKDLRLHYTIALLVCCACEMLAWHDKIGEHQVFTSLLPHTDDYRKIGKTLWEALRHGLAHNFRPRTIEVGKDRYRFSISSGFDPVVMVTPGNPHWIHLNVRELSMQVIARIDRYEERIRTRPEARRRFQDRSRTIKPLKQNAVEIAASLKAIGSSVS